MTLGQITSKSFHILHNHELALPKLRRCSGLIYITVSLQRLVLLAGACQLDPIGALHNCRFCSLGREADLQM